MKHTYGDAILQTDFRKVLFDGFHDCGSLLARDIKRRGRLKDRRQRRKENKSDLQIPNYYQYKCIKRKAGVRTIPWDWLQGKREAYVSKPSADINLEREHRKPNQMGVFLVLELSSVESWGESDLVLNHLVRWRYVLDSY